MTDSCCRQTLTPPRLHLHDTSVLAVLGVPYNQRVCPGQNCDFSHSPRYILCTCSNFLHDVQEWKIAQRGSERTRKSVAREHAGVCARTYLGDDSTQKRRRRWSKCVRVSVCVCVCVLVCVYACAFVLVSVRVRVCMCVCVYICEPMSRREPPTAQSIMLVCECVYTYTYTHMYTYARMYVYTILWFQYHLHYSLYREKNIDITSQSKWGRTSPPDVIVVFLIILDREN